MWYIYSMKYYSAIKRKEIMAFSATWMDLYKEVHDLGVQIAIVVGGASGRGRSSGA